MEGRGFIGTAIEMEGSRAGEHTESKPCPKTD